MLRGSNPFWKVKVVMRLKLVGVALGILVVCILIPTLIASSGFAASAGRKDFHIKARQYAFDPPRIIVDKGDEVHIRLTSLDVVHGFFLEGYDINVLMEPGKRGFKHLHPAEGKENAPVEEIVFTANRPGKFRYRCSHTCGTLHPFMQGEMIVRPNYPFIAGVGGAVGVLIVTFAILFLVGKNHRSSQLPSDLQTKEDLSESSGNIT
jgi:cytochrome c oxidase subunit 2